MIFSYLPSTKSKLVILFSVKVTHAIIEVSQEELIKCLKIDPKVHSKGLKSNQLLCVFHNRTQSCSF
jgi:hypothetical protein